MKERRKRLIHAFIDDSGYDFERVLALQVLAEAMIDLALNGKNGQRKKWRVEARHFFFHSAYRPLLNYWCDQASVNRNMVVRHAKTVYCKHHV